MKNCIGIIIILILTFLQVISAQIIDTSKIKIESVLNDSSQTNPPLVIIGKSYGDSVVLRWAPGNSILWKYSNKYGYVITRYIVSKIRTGDSTGIKKLTSEPIKPWPLKDWKRKSRRNDSLAAVSAQILYGKQFKASVKKGLNFNAILQQKADEDNRFSYALIISDIHPFAANGLGLRWVDKDIQKGATYLYTVYSLVPQNIIHSDTAAVIVRTNNILPVPSMPKIKVEELDKAVRFSWNSLLTRRKFTAFYLERSDDMGKTFHKTSSIPFVQIGKGKNIFQEDKMTIQDSLSRNYRKYIYRIIGITPFGERSKPSESMTVMGRDKTPPGRPTHVKAENIEANHVKLSWNKKIKEPDFAGYLIGRSQDIKGPYIPLFIKPLNKNSLSFIDTSAAEHGTNFYIVASIDTAGNSSAAPPVYVIMQDSTPPAKPTGLTGTIDSAGIVTLKWNMGKEEDLFGYQVYFANSAKHVFTPITKGFLIDSTFIDTISLNSMTSKIYYTIVAFDQNRNPSPYSDTLALTRPDTIRPVPPVIKSFTLTDSSVTFSWNPSTSEDADSQFVFRKQSKGAWKLLTKLDKNTESYSDTTVERLKRYKYALQTIDKTKLKSRQSFPLTVRVYDSGQRNLINSFSAELSKDKKSIRLKWLQKGKKNSKIIIYRNFNNTGFQMYDSTPGKINSFNDYNLQKGDYEYAIKVVQNDGTESPLSKLISIKITK